MCEPTTIAGIGVAAASAAYGIYTQRQQGAYQEGVARNNEMIAGWQRADALQRGVQAASAIRAQGAQYGALATAGAAANNIDSTTGSMGNIYAATAMTTEIDAETARANAAREAWGFANAQQDLSAQRRQIRRSTILGGIGTGLSGLGRMSVLGAQGYQEWAATAP